MKQKFRAEQDIFHDLSEVCSSPGYIHAIAYLCFKNNIVGFDETLGTEDVMNQYSFDTLIRNEISTLIGLMFKEDFSDAIPEPEVMQMYIETTEALLEEIHHSMAAAPFEDLEISKLSDEEYNPFSNAAAMREPIFYSGDSAYTSQYRDFSLQKYGRDNQWLIANKGFSIDAAVQVITSIVDIQQEKLGLHLQSMTTTDINQWTILPAFVFSLTDVLKKTNLDRSTVHNVLVAFSPPPEMKNQAFQTLSDFNVINAYPIIKLNDDQYLLFQYYSLVEALYETPFYWLCEDKGYFNEAMKNRGDFTEEFSAERLATVFGKNNVFTNINIIDSKKNKAGEIDVLVVFADRAIILQAKSKKLTLEARKGNDNVLKDDFKKSIQDSYDQALSCAKLIIDETYRLTDSSFKEIIIPRNYKEIYTFCVLSDHYPALSFQTRQFLRHEQSETILAPLVMDIFTLDIIAEMLNTPLQFLSYINRRVRFWESIMAPNELTILSYHLTKNLWVDSDYSMMLLDNDISADLDIAIYVRREGLPGNDTPAGILTYTKNTAIGRLIEQIEKVENPDIIDLGFMLLMLSGETIDKLNNWSNTLINRAKQDGKNHDFSMFFEETNFGLTIHYNNAPIATAGSSLQSHCEKRKYLQKANSWFGICIDPNNQNLRFGCHLNYEWQHSAEMDSSLNGFLSSTPVTTPLKDKGKKKVGRNDKCPCGSGLKYKKCCYDILENGFNSRVKKLPPIQH